jgi:hypothetical protein
MRLPIELVKCAFENFHSKNHIDFLKLSGLLQKSLAVYGLNTSILFNHKFGYCPLWVENLRCPITLYFLSFKAIGDRTDRGLECREAGKEIAGRTPADIYFRRGRFESRAT